MPNTYTLITSTTLSSSSSSVTFSALPTTFNDLVLRWSSRSSQNSVDSGVYLQINGDTGTTYSYRYLQGDGNVTFAGASAADYTGNVFLGYVTPGSLSTANTFSNNSIYIPNYQSTSSKPVSSIGVIENRDTTAYVTTAAGLYRGTSGISQLKIQMFSGNTFLSGSSFFLYGIK